jgi:hypothetical protein
VNENFGDGFRFLTFVELFSTNPSLFDHHEQVIRRAVLGLGDLNALLG